MFVTCLQEAMPLGFATETSRGQIRFAQYLDRYLGRIDRDVNGDPYQLFPMRRNANKGVAVNINLLAGQPVAPVRAFASST